MLYSMSEVLKYTLRQAAASAQLNHDAANIDGSCISCALRLLQALHCSG